MLTAYQIESNTSWLLENASNPVKYLTFKYLLNKEDDPIPELKQKIEDSELVRDILSKQQANGSWCSSGAWATKAAMRKSGYTPVSPKYVTTAWILPILGNLGYSIMDERIAKACEYVFSYQMENGYIAEIKRENSRQSKIHLQNEPCRFSLILIALAKVGAALDERGKKAFDLLADWQREDGGWVSENHSKQHNWSRSCPYSSYHSAYALYCSGLKDYEVPIKRALEFLLTHLSSKTDSEIHRFFYHGHSLIHELLMFTELRVGSESVTVDRLLWWLKSMYLEDDSYFKYSGKPVTKYNLKEDYMDSRVAKYRLFQLIEDDWLTYYATRIFKNYVDR